MIRIEQLTFTRFLAAFAIVVFHYGTKLSPFNIDTYAFLFRKAHLGVSYFFVLSGFVMIIAYGHKNYVNPIHYLKNRIARVYPVYLLALLVMVGYVNYKFNFINYTNLSLSLLCIQSWIPGKALVINGPGWSIPVEFLFYFSFPFLFNYIYRKFSYKDLVCPIILFWLMSQILMHYLRYSDFYEGFNTPSHDFIFYFPLMHLNEFLIGNLVGLFLIHNDFKHKNYDIHLIVLVVLTILLLKFQPNQINFHNGLLTVLFAPIIFFLSLNKGIVTRIFKFKYFVFLGEISYGVYILQKPVHVWVKNFLVDLNKENPTLFFWIYVLVLLIVSSIVYVIFEKPMRKVIRNFKFKPLRK